MGRPALAQAALAQVALAQVALARAAVARAVLAQAAVASEGGHEVWGGSAPRPSPGRRRRGRSRPSWPSRRARPPRRTPRTGLPRGRSGGPAVGGNRATRAPLLVVVKPRPAVSQRSSASS